MTRELELKLIQRFPQWFTEENHFDVGDGWYQLLHNLFVRIEDILYVNPSKDQMKVISVASKLDRKQDFVIDQIKEKWSALRLYWNVSKEFESVRGLINEAVRTAEDLSQQTCEVCGKKGKVRRNGWFKTLCDKHADGKTIEEEFKSFGGTNPTQVNQITKK